MNLFIIIGLCLDFIGASILASTLFVSKKKALVLGQSYWSGNTDEENLTLPPVQAILKDSKIAIWGVIILAIGFLAQIIGNLL